MNEIPEKFLDKENIIQVLLYFKKAVSWYIVFVKHSANIKHISCTIHSH